MVADASPPRVDDASLPHHYALLGLAPDAEPEAVKRAWKRAALRWHPDARPAGGQTGRFSALREAWEVLSEASRRAAYDALLQASVEGAVAAMSRLHGVQRIAGVVDRALGVAARRLGAGRNLRLRQSVGFAEAVAGTETSVQLEAEVRCEACDATGCSAAGRTYVCRACGGIGEVLVHGLLRSSWDLCRACVGLGWVPEPRCETCGGRGVVPGVTRWRVPIPAGTRDGQVLRIPGAGGAAPSGGVPGDLLVEIAVRPHAFLSVVGSDLRCERPVPFWLAITGGQVEVPTLEGKARIALPPGTRSGDVLRMAGWGLPRGAGHGDELVSVVVEWPKALDPTDAERLGAWASALPPATFGATLAFEERLSASHDFAASGTREGPA